MHLTFYAGRGQDVHVGNLVIWVLKSLSPDKSGINEIAQDIVYTAQAHAGKVCCLLRVLLGVLGDGRSYKKQ